MKVKRNLFLLAVISLAVLVLPTQGVADTATSESVLADTETMTETSFLILTDDEITYSPFWKGGDRVSVVAISEGIEDYDVIKTATAEGKTTWNYLSEPAERLPRGADYTLRHVTYQGAGIKDQTLEVTVTITPEPAGFLFLGALAVLLSRKGRR